MNKKCFEIENQNATAAKLAIESGRLRAENASLKNQQCAAWTESGTCGKVEALRAALKTLIHWIDHGIPDDPGPVCGAGPDCDGDKANMVFSYFSADLDAAREALAGGEERRE